MSDDVISDDFIVSAHAMERFQERFPELWSKGDADPDELLELATSDELGTSDVPLTKKQEARLQKADQQSGEQIHHECNQALIEGRASYIAPLELANNDLDRWEAGKGLVVWVPDKTRGYVLLESEEGLLVTTVLKGKTPSEARGMLYGEGGRPRRRSRKESA